MENVYNNRSMTLAIWMKENHHCTSFGKLTCVVLMDILSNFQHWFFHLFDCVRVAVGHKHLDTVFLSIRSITIDLLLKYGGTSTCSTCLLWWSSCKLKPLFLKIIIKITSNIFRLCEWHNAMAVKYCAKICRTNIGYSFY